MWNSGKKIRAFRDKKLNILTLVLSEKNILNETKNHTTPPFKLNGRSLSKLKCCRLVDKILLNVIFILFIYFSRMNVL